MTEDRYHRLLGDLLWERADTVIWLDLPRRTVMWRVVRRSILRALTRAKLWNGNRENWRDWVQPDHPIRQTWSHFYRRRTQTAERAAHQSNVIVIRLRTAREAHRWR